MEVAVSPLTVEQVMMEGLTLNASLLDSSNTIVSSNIPSNINTNWIKNHGQEQGV